MMYRCVLLSNDRFMTMATGLVLAIAVGTMVQNSDSLMAFFTGEDLATSQNDQFTVRAGSDQQLDVLANDKINGEISIVSTPSCGTIRTNSNDTLEFLNSGSCSGDVSFSYCVAAEGVCEEREVALNVVNTGTVVATAEPEVVAPAKPEVVAPAPTAAPITKLSSSALTQVSTTTTTIAETPTAITSSAQGDRLNAGQILVQDDSSDVVVAGFGSSSGPSLFAPNMEELIQPQETVATMRRSVEMVSLSRIGKDQNIQTQTSAATPSRVQMGGSSLSSNVSIGGDSSPTVSFSFASPSQPRLSPAPMLAPASTQAVAVAGLERGPSIHSITPRQATNVAANETLILTPISSETVDNFGVLTAMVVPTDTKSSIETDTSTAAVGSVMIVSSVGRSDVSSNGGVKPVTTELNAPATAGSPVLTKTADTALVEAGPAVKTASPSSIDVKENPIDSLVASIFNADTYIASIVAEGDAIETNDQRNALNTASTQTARVGAVSINSGDPADSSDIVVEMAAQILLPSPQLNDSLTRVIRATPAMAAMQTDKLFTANLGGATPPPAPAPTKVASISPTMTLDPVINSLAAQDCDARMVLAARPGAEIAVFVSSKCRAGQVLTISHSGFSFSAYLDNRGTYSATIPGFANASTVDVTYDDGTVTSSQVLLRYAANLERLAIVWSAPVNLDLHAFEGDATEGSEGHVSVNNARTYRDTLTAGGGFLTVFGDSSIVGGTMSEVYSLPTNRIRSNTTISMNLQIDGIQAYCGNNMILRTIRTENQGETTTREFNLKLPQCGFASGGLLLENFVEAISVAKR